MTPNENAPGAPELSARLALGRVATRELSVAIAAREDGGALDLRALAEDTSLSVPIAISSEAPVARFDYWDRGAYQEVLSHDASAVDGSYAADGMPFLVEHNGRDQIGIVENIRLDADRKMRGDVRFSASQRAQEFRRDMVDGIRKKISVGYRILDESLTAKDAVAGDTWTVSRWLPVEASTVSIPADYSGSGVGRSAAQPAPADAARSGASSAPRNPSNSPTGTQPEDFRTMADNAGAPAPTVSVGVADSQRVDGILALAGDNARPHAEARQFIAEGRSVGDYAAHVLTKLREAGASTAVTPPNPGQSFKLDGQDARRYSVVRALNALVEGRRDKAGLEFEVSDHLAKLNGRSTDGVLIPTTIGSTMPNGVSAEDAARGVRGIDGDLATRTQLSFTAGAGKGQESRFTEYHGFIDLLRSMTVTDRVGAQFLSGLVGDVGFVGQTASGSASWGAETANASLSSGSLGLRTMTPKVLQSATTYSRQLLRQSVLDVENLVRRDIAAIHARAVDLAALSGSGTSNQPKGITNWSGIGSVVGGTNGDVPTWDYVVGLQAKVAVANALAGTLSYVCHPLLASKMMRTQKFSGTNGDALWKGNILAGELGGFNASASTQVAAGVTKGTSSDTSPLIFGDFSSLIIGEWGSMEVLVDNITQGPALVKVMSIQMIDIFLRYVESFAVMADARTT